MENQKTKKGWGLFVLGTVVGLLVSLVITSVIFRDEVTYEEKKTSKKSKTGSELVDEDVLKKIDALEDIIREKFYLSEVTEEQLETGLYRGMIRALNDPYAEYYTEEELQALMEHSEGIYYGIGAYVAMDPETQLPKISGIIAGAPAEESELRPEDLVYMIDGTMTYGLTLTEATALIKGPEYTTVTLTVIREGESDYIDIEIERRKVESPTVNFEMYEDGIAYIQVTEFDEVTVNQFAEALDKAKESDMDSLILDLRGNPGGNLSAVVEMARMILPKGLIVYTEDKKGNRDEYSCNGKNQIDVPMVVLIDGNSASASEILAGAIQDYGIGTLVGTTTYGKGIVQQIVSLKDGSAIKLTISGYFTPNGRNIHGVGIEPDVECKFDSEAYYNEENPYDNQLEKAKELLK